MLPRVFRLTAVLLLGAAVPLLRAAPAGAQVEGSCTVTFNGIEVDRIDSLDSPLELDTADTLIFMGSVESGSVAAGVRLMIGPVTIERGSSTYQTVAQEFDASLPLGDVTPYGVGLFRVVGEADGCVARAWVRVSGRVPFTTLTGLIGLGLALGGLTGQLGAIASRTRWSRSAAALGGVATGPGVAVLAQQFGRLQVSYPSLAASAAVAAALGFGTAWTLNPALREGRAARRKTATSATGSRPVPTRVERRPAGPRSNSPPPARSDVEHTDREDEVSGGSTDRDRTPDDAGHDRDAPDHTAPYWCYVVAPTDVFDLQDHTRTVATLVPGTWYLAKRDVGGWTHVVVSEADEGWVAESAIHRQG